MILCIQLCRFDFTGRSKCLSVFAQTTDTNEIFEFSFKFDREGVTTITQIAFFNSSSPPEPTTTPITSPGEYTNYNIEYIHQLHHRVYTLITTPRKIHQLHHRVNTSITPSR